jgi:hypothetical protein
MTLFYLFITPRIRMSTIRVNIVIHIFNAHTPPSRVSSMAECVRAVRLLQCQDGYKCKPCGRLTWVCYVDMREGSRPPRSSWYGSLFEALVNDFDMVRAKVPHALMSIRVCEDQYNMTFWSGDGRVVLDIKYLEDKSLKYNFCLE